MTPRETTVPWSSQKFFLYQYIIIRVIIYFQIMLYKGHTFITINIWNIYRMAY